MNRHRIEVAIAHLRSIPEKVANQHFYMPTWFDDIAPVSAKALAKSCGSTACAAGWLTYVPEFIEAGLSRDGYGDGPVFDGYECAEALGAFFGISTFTAIQIFETWDDGNYRGKVALDAVCAKLEALL